MKIVTFLIPCYNSETYMHKCIDSLLVSDTDIEIIIVDDGSTDQTGLIADRYCKNYPDIVKVIHQKNGGHGAGIMAGVRDAKGYYFKVIDSDDWADCDNIGPYLATLRQLKEQGDVQLVVNDYVYEYIDGHKPDCISYNNVFEENCVQGWDRIRGFSINQYLTIHSCTFMTKVLRECNLNLPRHTFYEDNLFIYKPLPLVKNIYYMNATFYHYYIGRPGQSMQEDNLKQRCDHQIRVSKAIFSAYDIKDIYKHNPKLGKVMMRENILMLTAATVFARLNKDKISEEKVREMWRELAQIDASMARSIKYGSMAFLVTRPGRVGRNFAILNYKAAHKVLKFN